MRLLLAVLIVALLAAFQVATHRKPTSPPGPSGPSVAWAAPLFGDNDEDDDDEDDDDEDDDDEFDEDGDSLDGFVDETVDAANAYWAAMFKQLGKSYHPPTVVKAHHDDRITSRCGNSRGAEHSYCGQDEKVFLDWDSDDEASIENLWNDDRSFIIVTTVGHEWGHHVQQLLGIFDIDTRGVEVENQADCLMGLFANTYAKSSDWVGRSDLKDAIADTGDAGDDPSTPAAQRTHGTPEQRVEAYLRGYKGRTLAACGI